MTPISIAGVGAIGTTVELALHAFNVQLPEGSIASLLNGLATVVSVCLLIYGQVRRKDLRFGIFRIK